MRPERAYSPVEGATSDRTCTSELKSRSDVADRDAIGRELVGAVRDVFATWARILPENENGGRP